MDIGKKIKEIRIEKGITQKELADKLGTSRQNLSQYENGKRNPKEETITRIAKALDVPRYIISGNRADVFTGNAETDMEYLKKRFDLQLFADPELSPSDLRALEHFRPLNDDNKDKAIDYMDLLKTSQDHNKE